MLMFQKFSSRKQCGAVLVVGLLMLTVMTLLAVSSMQSSSLQSLMANNLKDEMTAFEAAESAIRAAEEFLDNGSLNLGAFDGDKSDGLFANLYDEVWKEIDWTNESVEVGSVVVDSAQKGGVKTKPRYVIQYIGPVVSEEDRKLNIDNSYEVGATEALVQMFKITARGTGGSDNTQVVLESMYGVSN